jgi:hypothetical protein
MSEPFRGVVDLDIRDSSPDWAPFSQPVAPPGTPNVVYVVLDDVGLGALGCYGGGTLHGVAVDVSGTPYVDLEREAAAMLSRE